MSFYRLTTAYCSLTKKARKITAAQHKGKSGTFGLCRAVRRVRHDFYFERATNTDSPEQAGAACIAMAAWKC